jgi:hypothetical protein
MTSYRLNLDETSFQGDFRLVRRAIVKGEPKHVLKIFQNLLDEGKITCKFKGTRLDLIEHAAEYKWDVCSDEDWAIDWYLHAEGLTVYLEPVKFYEN